MSVRFVQLDLREVCIPFRFRFKHALAERGQANSLLLSLQTESGHVGYGEVVPRQYLTGETTATAWEDITTRWWPALQGLTLSADTSCTSVLDALQPLYEQADGDRHTAAYAGVDVAAVDAYARAHDIAGNRLFGQTPRAERLSAPIADASPGKTAWITRLFWWLGFRQFKLKVGSDDDVARIQIVRRVIGAGSDLRVDANAAWQADEAVSRIEALKDAGISSVEQPVGPGTCAAATVATDLVRIQQQTGVPVMADESLCTRSDAQALLGKQPEDRVLLWNVRVAKVGGFSGALALTRLADAHGVGVHLGVLVGETTVLSAAQRALFGLTEFTHVEYGFPRVLLRADPFSPAPGGLRGWGRPLGKAPGLGIHPCAQTLARVTVRREVLT